MEEFNGADWTFNESNHSLIKHQHIYICQVLDDTALIDPPVSCIHARRTRVRNPPQNRRRVFMHGGGLHIRQVLGPSFSEEGAILHIKSDMWAFSTKLT